MTSIEIVKSEYEKLRELVQTGVAKREEFWGRLYRTVQRKTGTTLTLDQLKAICRGFEKPGRRRAEDGGQENLFKF